MSKEVISDLVEKNNFADSNVPNLGICFVGSKLFCTIVTFVIIVGILIESAPAIELAKISSKQQIDVQRFSLLQTQLDFDLSKISPQYKIVQVQLNQPSAQKEDRNSEQLFEQLSKATSVDEANKIAYQIQQRWLDSGSDTVDLLMRGADNAIQFGYYSRALDLLDAVIRLKPEYAEGWNRRATLHYLLGSYDLSISDIEQTLAIEPKHWGALSGLAAIMQKLEKPNKTKALELYEQINKIHPHLPSILESIENLKSELSGQEL